MLMFLLGLAPQAHATDALLGLNADVGVVAPPDRIGGATHTDHGVSIAFFLPGDTVPTDEQGEVDGRDLVRLGAGLISIDIGRGLGISSYNSIPWTVVRLRRSAPVFALEVLSHDLRLNTAELVPERTTWRPAAYLGVRTSTYRAFAVSVGARGGWAASVFSGPNGPLVGGHLNLQAQQADDTLALFSLTLDGSYVAGDRGGFSGLVGVTGMLADLSDADGPASADIVLTSRVDRLGAEPVTWQVSLGLAIGVGRDRPGRPEGDEPDD